MCTGKQWVNPRFGTSPIDEVWSDVVRYTTSVGKPAVTVCFVVDISKRFLEHAAWPLLYRSGDRADYPTAIRRM